MGVSFFISLVIDMLDRVKSILDEDAPREILTEVFKAKVCSIMSTF